eukprot:3203920-Prymnesium_polylepis.1
MRAAQNGDESGVVVLLQAGADRTVKNLEGDTALQITHKHGHVGVAVSLASNVLASPALVKPSLAVGLPKQAGKRPKQALDRALKPNTGASVAREDYDPPSLRRAVAGAPRSQDCCRRYFRAHGFAHTRVGWLAADGLLGWLVRLVRLGISPTPPGWSTWGHSRETARYFTPGTSQCNKFGIADFAMQLRLVYFQ